MRYITILLQSSWNDIYTCGMCILSSLVSRSSIVGRVGKSINVRYRSNGLSIYRVCVRRLPMDSLRMSEGG